MRGSRTIAAFRFVHTADIHLDSPLRSLAMRKPDLAELIGNATRRAFVRVVDLCLEERVDALLIAGDLYDGDQTSMKTASFLAAEMRRLDEAGTRVFVIRGNHDALSRITRELTLPPAVKLFRGRAEAVAIERGRGEIPIVVHGLSFSEPHAPESLLGKYRPPVEGAVNVGLMHTSLDGAAGHDPYAPCSLADLERSGFRYWALGHVHRRRIAEGGCTVVMPGMPQGRDINESGPKSVTLAKVGDDGAVTIEERITSLAEFQRIEIDAGGIADWRDLVSLIGRSLRAVSEGLRLDQLVVRLHLRGATPLAWRLRRDSDLLLAEAEQQAAMIGRIWVEAVEVGCRAPVASPTEASDPLSELRRLVEAEILGSDAYRQEVGAIAADLARQLPAELRGLIGEDDAAREAAVLALARDGTEDVLAWLQSGRRAERP